MKTTLLTISIILLAKMCLGQVNFYKFTLGGGLRATRPYTDVNKKSVQCGAYLEGIFNLTPYLITGLEWQFGQLKGGDKLTDPNQREFVNRYQMLSLNVKVALGQFINYTHNGILSFLRGTYIGSGFGAVKNHVIDIVRYQPGTATQFPPYGYEFPGKKRSLNLLLPIYVGYNLYLKDNFYNLRYILTINWETNITFGEGLDGYNDPLTSFNNNAPDIYTFFSLGFKYNFGKVGLTKKSL